MLLPGIGVRPIVLGSALGSVFGTALFLPGAPAARADVTPATGSRALGTLVNQACGSSSCALTITGGTAAGSNLFHRFQAFDTRSNGGGLPISGAAFLNSGFSNVIVGVLSPTTISVPLSLQSPASLFWLSPAGITVIGGGSFSNVTNLTLSTATGLRFSSGEPFDAIQSTAAQAATLSGAPVPGRAGLVTNPASLALITPGTNGSIELQGGLLSVDQNLLLDAQGGNVLLNGAQLIAGERLQIQGDALSLEQSALDVANSTGLGGEVLLEGQRISLRNVAIDASGRDGGGQILVGGGYRGMNPDLRNADSVLVDTASRLQADAWDVGNGGKVVIYANESASVGAVFSARGGVRFGNGGLVETSATRLSIGDIGAVDLTAAAGTPGTWLIDPADFSIVSSGNQPNTIRASVLQDQLAIGNVRLETTNASGSQLGDIHVNAPVSWSANRLTLSAFRNINVNQSLLATGTGSLSFHYGQGTGDGLGATYVVSPTAIVEVPLTQTGFLWKKGSLGFEYPVLLDNGSLRFWRGAESNASPLDRFSFNGAGLLQQPAYLDSFGSWRKLTFSDQPLEFALGLGGDGSSNWNASGTIIASGSNTSYLPSAFSSLGVSNGRMDVSRFLEGAGTVVTKVDLNPPSVSSASLRLNNQYTLSAGATSLRVDTTIENLSSSPLTNVRYWYGTGDDWINTNDSPTKIRGNLTGIGFTAIAQSTDPSNAIQISDGAQSVIFYSPSPGVATTGLGDFGEFSNRVVPVDPSAAPVINTNDGSYGIYLRYPDINPQSAASSTYLYTTGSAGVATMATWDWSTAQPIVGSGEYDWFNALNWTGGILPGNDFAVTISDDPIGQRVVLFDPATYYSSSSTSSYNLRLFGLASAESLRIASGTLIFGSQVFNSFELSNQSSLIVDGGTSIVNGSLMVPVLSLQDGIFSGSGRVSVNGNFLQAQGSTPAMSNVLMGQQFDSFSINSSVPLTIRELYSNGPISVSSTRDLAVTGSIQSNDSRVYLGAGSSGDLNSSILLSRTSRIKVFGDNVLIGASGVFAMEPGALVDASSLFGDGGQVQIQARDIFIDSIDNSVAINTSGLTTGGQINIGASRFTSTVSFRSSLLSADPPLEGGIITVLGDDIYMFDSIMDVTGGARGLISLGDSFTAAITIQGGAFVGGGEALFNLVANQISVSGLTVIGGVYRVNELGNPQASVPYTPLPSSTDSAAPQPDPSPFATLPLLALDNLTQPPFSVNSGTATSPAATAPAQFFAPASGGDLPFASLAALNLDRAVGFETRESAGASGSTQAPDSVPSGITATAVPVGEARAAYLEGESRAARDTAEKLGLAQDGSQEAPTPERLQGVMQGVQAWLKEKEKQRRCRTNPGEACKQ